MTVFKKIVTDPAFWSLLLMNSLFIKYFHDHPGNFKTYLWIYWLQSVLIGVFNFFNLLTIRKAVAGSLVMDKVEANTGNTGRGCNAAFFLFHFEGFHFVYAIFLATGFRDACKFDPALFKYAALCILVNQLIWFIQNKLQQRNKEVNAAKLFFIPYLRIIPMHFVILIPAFIHISSPGLFLVLKTFMDVIMHLVTTEWYWKKGERVTGDIANTDLL